MSRLTEEAFRDLGGQEHVQLASAHERQIGLAAEVLGRTQDLLHAQCSLLESVRMEHERQQLCAPAVAEGRLEHDARRTRRDEESVVTVAGVRLQQMAVDHLDDHRPLRTEQHDQGSDVVIGGRKGDGGIGAAHDDV